MKKIFFFVFLFLLSLSFNFLNGVNASGVSDFSLAFEHYDNKNYEESLNCFYRLLKSYPNNVACYFNMGVILQKLWQLDQSNNFFNKFLELDPDNISVHKLLGVNYLTLGNLQKGYEHYDIFFKEKDANHKKLWRADDLCGKTIYIVDNIGIGDVFCFMQYAKSIKDHYLDSKVVLGVRKYLIPIVSSCPFIDKVVPRFEQYQDCDYYVYMHMLPRMAYKAGFGIPCHVPYLFADEKLLEKWKKFLEKHSHFKIGICWDASLNKGKKTGKFLDNKRSIPLHYFYALSKLPGVGLYSLQRVNGTEQINEMPKDFEVHVFDENFDKANGSFSDTAAVMKHLDLVITVDTSVAHLAGALGVPVWMILNRACNWRWFLKREDSLWYQTMRIFRQKEAGDWESVMLNVITELNKFLISP